MRRIGIVVFAFVFLGLPFSSSGIAAPARVRTPPADRGRFVHNEVLVAFRPGANPAVFARAFGGRVDAELAGLGVHVLKVPSGAVEHVVAALSANPQVDFAEPNVYLHLFLEPNDPYVSSACYWTSANQCVSQWAWTNVNAYAAWDNMTGSSSVRVAVVDTGIDVGNPTYFTPDPTGHADIVSCQSPIIKSFISGETGNDDHGHGTHVAGTIGACTNNGLGVAGANWAVQLMGVKVLDFSGSGSLSAVAQGIRWAADNGAKVINLSLGTNLPARTLEKAIKYAWNKGAVLVCAAGNSGTTQPTYPAAYANCISVAATNQNDAKASFSTYGSWVTVAAPGVNILSTVQDNWLWCFLCYWFGYLPEYDALSGTSMATPHVAGLAALIWAKGVCTTNICVRQQIEQTADAIPGTGVYWKFGRVNYYNALK